MRDLWEKKLVPIQRVSALERDLARLEGEKGTLVSTIAQVRGRITETRLQILQIDQDLRTEVGKELAEIRSKMSEYAERRITAQDQLKRVEIRAPQDGWCTSSRSTPWAAWWRRVPRSCRSCRPPIT